MSTLGMAIVGSVAVNSAKRDLPVISPGVGSAIVEKKVQGKGLTKLRAEGRHEQKTPKMAEKKTQVEKRNEQITGEGRLWEEKLWFVKKTKELCFKGYLRGFWRF